MLQIRDAVQKSQQYLADLFPEVKGKDLLLESAELSDDSGFWYVTFSYYPTGKGSGAGTIMRHYKTMKVRAADGELFGARNGLLAQGLM